MPPFRTTKRSFIGHRDQYSGLRLDIGAASRIGSKRSFMKWSSLDGWAAARRRPGAGAARRPAAARRSASTPGAPVRPVRVRGRGRAPLPGLDLAPRDPRARRRRPGGDGRRGSPRSSPSRGKMHNPETDSGGVLLGTVSAVGERFAAPPAARRADRHARLADADPAAPRRGHRTRPRLGPGRGRAVRPTSASAPPGAPLPDDLPLETALEVYDVYGAGSHTRDLASRRGDRLRARRRPRRQARAGRRSRRDDRAATLVAVDVDEAAVERVAPLGLCDVAVAADLRDPLAALDGAREPRVAAGRPDRRRRQRARLRADGDPAHRRRRHGALLLDGDQLLDRRADRRRHGLRDIRMLIGNGFAPDRGAYGLDLAAPLAAAARSRSASPSEEPA